jgi:hypothetical protein
MPRSSSKAHHEFFRGTTVMTIHRIAAVGAASVLSCVVAATAAQSQVRTTGATTMLALPSQTSQLGAQIDFANAKPMRMPAANVAAPSPAKAMASALDPLKILDGQGLKMAAQVLVNKLRCGWRPDKIFRRDPG